jgi:L-ornithine N5-oxygenase
MIDHVPYDLLGIGFGPSNLGLAAAVASAPEGTPSANKRAVFLERRPHFGWHPDMLVDGARMQVVFLKDLVTLTNPTSPLTFINFLHEQGRLEDFLNLRSLYATRAECHDYFEWAAAKLRRLVRYGCEVTGISPRRGSGGDVELIEVRYRDTATGEVHERLARNVVLSLGGKPSLPASVDPSTPDDRIFHSANFLSRVALFAKQGKERPYRFLVVGAGQSAAEAFEYLAREFPAASVTLALRGFGLMPANSSPLSNEIFNSEMVSFFFDLPEARKQQVLQSLRHTNYAAVDEHLIETIFSALYEQKRRKEDRLRLLRLHEFASCEGRAEDVVVTLKDLGSGTSHTESYDGVVLATGYDFRHSERLLNELNPYLRRTDAGELIIRRDYSIETAPSLRARIYVQGNTEHTHGLTSTLLSILPYRARDILVSAFKTADADADAELGVATSG